MPCLVWQCSHTVLAVKDEHVDVLAACGGLRSLTAALRCARGGRRQVAYAARSRHMYRSTVGRPRKATQAQVEIILKWQRERRTLAQLAADLGLATSTVKHVLRMGGQYKQPPPEERAAALAERTAHVYSLADKGWL